MKIEEICRTCLSESSDLRSIFKLGVIAGKTTTLSKVLMEFAKLTINESDPLPDRMCYGCVIQANQSFAFLQTCIESDRYLKENLVINKKKTPRRNASNDDNVMTEAETQTVYLYNAINIEGENEINVRIEPSASQIKSVKKESVLGSVTTEQNQIEEEIVLQTEEDASEQNPNETETIHSIVDEDENLETEILEEIENEGVADNGRGDVGANSNSSYEHMNTEDEEFYEEDSQPNDSKIDDSKSVEELTFEQIIKVENNDESVDDSYMDREKVQRKRKIRQYSSKISISGPPYICSICQKQLSTKSSYKYHMQLHSDATPFLCNECGEGFKTRNAYEGHMTTHDTNNPHKCEVCGKIYRQANSLKTHMLTHTGEKPYLCGICGKGMTQKSGFKKHMLVHSGEMPFECEVCHKKFRYSSNLIAHKKTHVEKKENELLCKICDKLCKSVSDLRKHIAISHPQSQRKTPAASFRVLKHFSKSQFKKNESIGRVEDIIEQNLKDSIEIE